MLASHPVARASGYWFLPILVALAACSTQRPVVYPNDQFRRAGEERVQRDIDECLVRAQEFAKGGSQAEARAREAAESTAYGGASGAAIGAVGGAISGGAGQGAAIGAATGATAGLLHALFGSLFGPSGPDPLEAGYVDRCLREKGYDPIGWR